MNLSFTEEQEILRKFAREFLTGKFPKKVVRELEESEPGYSAALWKEMAELGWLGLPFPERYGGSGMKFLDLAVLLEEMGRACMPGPYFSTIVLGGYPVLDYGNEAQKQSYLPGIARGEAIATLALTEAGGGYAPSSIQTRATPDAESWVISGTKLFVPDGHVADYILCLARTADTLEPEGGLTVFLVDAGADGVVRTPLRSMAGKLAEVKFSAVKVPGDSVVGRLNEGWEKIKQIINRAEVAMCCQMAGMSQQVLDMTVEYARDRKQFDRPIGSFQVIQHYCADMFTDVEGMKLSAYHAAWKLNEGLPGDEEIAVAKAWAVQAANRIMGLAHQVFGAIGATMEYDLHYYTRWLKAAELSFRDASFYQERVAQEMGL